MHIWEWLETKIPLGNATADAAALRDKTAEATGDIRSIDEFNLFQLYNAEADERFIFSPLLRHFARRHLREAIRSAKYYPAPLAIRAATLAKEGELFDAAKEWDYIIAAQRAWIKETKDPNGSMKLTSCTYLATAGATHNVLARYDESLFYYFTAFEEFNQLAFDVRKGQSSLEDQIWSGVVISLLGQFRYSEALSFINLVFEGEMFAEYQSEERHALRVQKQLLPELVLRTDGYEFPKEGLELWTELMEKAQSCDGPDEAREIRAKIMSAIERHETAQQVRHLEDTIVELFRKSSNIPAPGKLDRPPAPTPPDLSAIRDPEWRETFTKMHRANQLMWQKQEEWALQCEEAERGLHKALREQTQLNIAVVHETASAIYRVPGWFRMQWNVRAVARLGVKFLAVEFLIGKILEDLVESKGHVALEQHLRSGLISTVVVMIVLLPLSKFLEQRIDKIWLRSYKQLLQRLVADRVSSYWMTYNTLLKVFTDCKQEADKLTVKLQELMLQKSTSTGEIAS